ncbi:DUF3102 domain-containing protein [Anaerococcus sp. AGMB09787]|uniref:DUF3102 domain-containing protein n=1 Tax=Anaerococcus sp. AGMB09787 TaxID=2922869 RepID=UPI001FAFF426|nr:DUF3102 domain-containing protein [Anaerococcus sp. AGMB09787]
MNELVSLNQIVSEIRFFENQAVVSYWEIGKRLSQAKEQVEHGEWKSWIDDNLGYSQETARKLIKIYDEFPNSTTLWNLTFTKALALTSIKDEEERQDFIEKHDVEDMTTRKLQAEIKKYKRSLEETENELEAAKAGLEFKDGQIEKYSTEKNRLSAELELAKMNKVEPEIIEKEVIKEVVPDDYELTKVQLENANKKLARLMDINQSLKEKEKLAMSKLESEQANKKIVEDVSGFHYKIAGFIQEVGGLLYLTEYLDDIPKDNKKLFLDSAKYLREFSEQLYKNIEEHLKEI